MPRTLCRVRKVPRNRKRSNPLRTPVIAAPCRAMNASGVPLSVVGLVFTHRSYRTGGTPLQFGCGCAALGQLRIVRPFHPTEKAPIRAILSEMEAQPWQGSPNSSRQAESR
jgi:hypothetical protein